MKCKICGAEHYAKGLCRRCYERERYRNSPEVREKSRKYHKEYNQRPEVKAKHREAVRKYCHKKREEFLLQPCFPKNVIDGKRRLRTLKHMPEEQDRYLEFARPRITECEYEELQRYLKEIRND